MAASEECSALSLPMSVFYLKNEKKKIERKEIKTTENVAELSYGGDV